MKNINREIKFRVWDILSISSEYSIANDDIGGAKYLIATYDTSAVRYRMVDAKTNIPYNCTENMIKDALGVTGNIYENHDLID